MDPIFNLLTRLSTDPYLQEAFARDPGAVMAQAGLSKPEQDMILSGKARDEAARRANGWVPCVTTGDPGPDPFEDPDPPPGLQA
jgi:hypothetical protein